MKKKKANVERKSRPSGGAHLKAAGKTGILIGLTADQLDALDRACEIEGRSRANFVAYYSVAAAMKLISEQLNGK